MDGTEAGLPGPVIRSFDMRCVAQSSGGHVCISEYLRAVRRRCRDPNRSVGSHSEKLDSWYSSAVSGIPVVMNIIALRSKGKLVPLRT